MSLLIKQPKKSLTTSNNRKHHNSTLLANPEFQTNKDTPRTHQTDPPHHQNVKKKQISKKTSLASTALSQTVLSQVSPLASQRPREQQAPPSLALSCPGPDLPMCGVISPSPASYSTGNNPIVRESLDGSSPPHLRLGSCGIAESVMERCDWCGVRRGRFEALDRSISR
jgi:hypothetical protein